MKKLYLVPVLILGCIQAQAQVIYGVNNYTQYHVGTLPVVISVPHGGLVAPASIPNRTCNNPTTVTDGRTIELARQIDTALFNLTGCRPHLIICNLRRTKIDCNRNIEDGACGNSEAETAWTEFHDFIDTAQFLAQNQYEGKALYIDLHGHGKMPYRLELGYGLSGTAYNNTDSVLNTQAYIASSSIGNLVNTNVSGSTHAQLLRGDYALGTLLADAGFPSVPSRQSPNTGGFPYFNGGYNTFNYTCLAPGNTVNGLQIECDSIVRSNYPNRKLFADSAAAVLVRYLFIHQDLDLLTNCGLPVSASGHVEPEDHTFAVYPNPVTDVLEFSAAQMKGNYEVLIINTLGEVVASAINQSRLPVSHLADGLYFVRLRDDRQHIWCSKFIKQSVR